MRPAVFLDRDGTLIEEVGYLDRLDRLEFFPYSIDAVRLLNRAGFAVAVVTNQSGVARGLFTEDLVRETHAAIAGRLADGGAHADGFYYCPHHPRAVVEGYRQACDCRKPQPGLLLQASRELGVDLSRSFAVGDRVSDLEAASGVGVRSVLVRTGYGSAHEAEARARGAAVTGHLMEAVSWMLRQS